MVLQDKSVRSATVVRHANVTSSFSTFERKGRGDVPLNMHRVNPSSTADQPVKCVRYMASVAEGVKVLDLSDTRPETKPSVRKTEITYEELVTLIEMGSAHVYDVREPNEIEESNVIPAAINIPLTKLKASLQMDPEQFRVNYFAAKPPTDDPNIVFYGFGSVKSMAAVEIAHKLGFKKARHFPGGWDEWSRHGIQGLQTT